MPLGSHLLSLAVYQDIFLDGGNFLLWVRFWNELLRKFIIHLVTPINMRSPLAFFKPMYMFVCTVYDFYMIVWTGNQGSQTYLFIMSLLMLVVSWFSLPKSHNDANFIVAEAEGCPDPNLWATTPSVSILEAPGGQKPYLVQFFILRI